jgi:hypothetical protein
VAELIDHARGRWSFLVLNEVFVGSSVAAICAIPLPNVEAHDSLIWKHASNGKFSVSSTYQLAIRLKTKEGMIGSFCRETNRRVWKRFTPSPSS